MVNNANIEDIAQNNLEKNQTVDQFGVAQIPFHAHTGADAQQINFKDLIGRFEFLNEVLPGTSAATAGNYGVIFTAPYKCKFMGATEVHSTKGTGGACTLQIEKLIGTTATGSGINMLSSPFDLTAVINTVQKGILSIVPKTTFALNPGDRLGLSLTGTPTSVAQVCVVIQLSY